MAGINDFGQFTRLPASFPLASIGAERTLCPQSDAGVQKAKANKKTNTVHQNLDGSVLLNRGNSNYYDTITCETTFGGVS
jgi:hypothetical protein